ncbi:MAG: sugar phosphate isomerase/epimerase [Hyphomicrobiales bacterium]|nr:MAG: sugar phosphate isomerase/epimerase [Hyphomicrobiales bacterium]
MTLRPLALAHLTLLGCAPSALVEIAAQSGFSMVGVRVLPATLNEVRYPLHAGSPMVAQTRRALSSAGIGVLDVEALSLDGQMTRELWLPALEVAGELGASVLNVIGADPDPHRLRDSFAALCADAAAHGVRASLEPISYQPIRTVSDAAEVIEDVECGGIMLDTLHFQRAGSAPREISALPRSLFSVIQLSDGPPAPRVGVVVPKFDPMAQAGETSARVIESRVQRDLPGEGIFPLTEILRRVHPETPISVEVPNPRLIAEIGPFEYARRAFVAANRVLDTVDPAPTPRSVRL